jgi:starvation-inducible outer membrane lipoprotein
MRIKLLVITMCLGLSACAQLSGFNPMSTPETPKLDAKFGDTVRAARLAQTLDPQASVRNAGKVSVVDTESAVLSVDTMRETFKTPPPSFTIFGIPVQGSK